MARRQDKSLRALCQLDTGITRDERRNPGPARRSREHVSVLVDHIHTSRVLVFTVAVAVPRPNEVRRSARLQMEWVAGNVLRRGLFRVDDRAADAGIFLGDELDGNLAEVRITVVGVAVGISQFHRLHNGVNIVGGVVAHRLEVKSLQEVEVLEKNRRLAPEAHLVNLDASISSLERFFNPRVVGCEVSFAQQATRLLAEIADPLCNGPAVKVVPDGFQGGNTSLSGVLPLDLRQTLEGPRKI